VTALDVELDREVSAFFHADPATIAWPYPMYERWQRGAGVVRWESGPALVVTRHRDVKAVMSNVYPNSHNGYRYGRLAEGVVSRLPPADHELFFRIMDFESLFMSRNDGKEHARLRRISSRAFTARRIELLRESIERHIDDLVAPLRDRDVVDVKTDLANQLPVRVIVDLIGIPQADRNLIWEWGEALAAHMSPGAESLKRADQAIEAFREYVHAMVERMRRTGDGPELPMLMLDQKDNDALTEDELVAMFVLILFGGSETTTNLLGNGFLALQRNRDQWDRLVADPSLVRPAIEELIRYDSPHHYLPRVALADFEIGGEQVRAGDTMIIVMGAANRDPDVFDEPTRLDVTRSNASDHLSFGFGAYFCLGAALARLEGELVFTRLVSEFPQARLLTDDITYGGSAMLRAIQHLPTNLAPSKR
jgi:cytochrome P450